MPTHNKASHAYARLCLIIVSNILDSEEEKNVPWSWIKHILLNLCKFIYIEYIGAARPMGRFFVMIDHFGKNWE